MKTSRYCAADLVGNKEFEHHWCWISEWTGVDGLIHKIQSPIFKEGYPDLEDAVWNVFEREREAYRREHPEQ